MPFNSISSLPLDTLPATLLSLDVSFNRLTQMPQLASRVPGIRCVCVWGGASPLLSTLFQRAICCVVLYGVHVHRCVLGGMCALCVVNVPLGVLHAHMPPIPRVCSGVHFSVLSHYI